MNKIKTLLEKAGCNPELAGSICESLEEYKTSVRRQFESDYQTRISRAKKVCVEETEEHKRQLAHRVQVFCEAKAAAIEAQLAKQAAISESAAVTKLKNVLALLEGIELNGESNRRATATLEKAKQKIQQVNEERKRAVSVANRQVAISEKALTENRRLAKQVSELQRQLTESKQRPTGQRLVESRAPSTPKTSRPVLENRARRTAKTAPAGNNKIGVADIAANMDADLI